MPTTSSIFSTFSTFSTTQGLSTDGSPRPSRTATVFPLLALACALVASAVLLWASTMLAFAAAVKTPSRV